MAMKIALLLLFTSCLQYHKGAVAFVPTPSRYVHQCDVISTTRLLNPSPPCSSSIRLQTNRCNESNKLPLTCLLVSLANPENKDQDELLSKMTTKAPPKDNTELSPSSSKSASMMDALNPVELMVLASWMGLLSIYILINNFIGPWPVQITMVSDTVWLLIHSIAGMLFGGGIILSTCIEWMVAQSKELKVMNFWFDKVPAIDMIVVLPAISMAIISGGGLAAVRYGGLGVAPFHVKHALLILVLFAVWWAATDVTTQRPAAQALLEQLEQQDERAAAGDRNTDVPRIVQLRKVSNVVSCMLVLALYAIMLLKPGL